MLVGTRTAVWAEAMRADGVIISSDGWGNSDVDYTNTCEQLGTRGIAVTGLNFSGTVAQFVVVNDYLDGSWISIRARTEQRPMWLGKTIWSSWTVKKRLRF